VGLGVGAMLSSIPMWTTFRAIRTWQRAIPPRDLQFSMPVVTTEGLTANIRPSIGASGQPAAQFQIIMGQLPLGLKLDRKTGEISGTPRLKDEEEEEANRQVYLVVKCFLYLVAASCMVAHVFVCICINYTTCLHMYVFASTTRHELSAANCVQRCTLLLIFVSCSDVLSHPHCPSQVDYRVTVQAFNLKGNCRCTIVLSVRAAGGTHTNTLAHTHGSATLAPGTLPVVSPPRLHSVSPTLHSTPAPSPAATDEPAPERGHENAQAAQGGVGEEAGRGLGEKVGGGMRGESALTVEQQEGGDGDVELGQWNEEPGLSAENWSGVRGMRGTRGMTGIRSTATVMFGVDSIPLPSQTAVHVQDRHRARQQHFDGEDDKTSQVDV